MLPVNSTNLHATFPCHYSQCNTVFLGGVTFNIGLKIYGQCRTILDKFPVLLSLFVFFDSPAAVLLCFRIIIHIY